MFNELEYTEFQSRIGNEVFNKLSSDPSKLPDERILRIAAKVLWSLGLINQSLTAMRMLDKFDLLDADDLHKIGCWDLYIGEIRKSKVTIERALKLAPNESIIKLAYAYSYFYSKDYGLAASLFAELKNDPSLKSPSVMADAARKLMEGLKPNQIHVAPIPSLPTGLMEALQIKLMDGEVASLAHIAKIASNVDEMALFSLQRLEVEFLINLDRDDDALRKADSILDKLSDDGSVLYLKGIASRKLGKVEESQRSFELAVKRAPLEPRAWAAAGAGFIENNQPDRAWEFYRIAIFLEDNNSNTWGDAGMCHYLLGKYEEANKAITHAIELGAHTFTNYLNRALTRKELNDTYGTISDFTKAVVLDPSHPKSESILELLKEAGRYDGRFQFGEELILQH